MMIYTGIGPRNAPPKACKSAGDRAQVVWSLIA